MPSSNTTRSYTTRVTPEQLQEFRQKVLNLLNGNTVSTSDIAALTSVPRTIALERLKVLAKMKLVQSIKTHKKQSLWCLPGCQAPSFDHTTITEPAPGVIATRLVKGCIDWAKVNRILEHKKSLSQSNA